MIEWVCVGSCFGVEEVVFVLGCVGEVYGGGEFLIERFGGDFDVFGVVVFWVFWCFGILGV